MREIAAFQVKAEEKLLEGEVDGWGKLKDEELIKLTQQRMTKSSDCQNKSAPGRQPSAGSPSGLLHDFKRDCCPLF